MALTTDFSRTPPSKAGQWLTEINGQPPDERMTKLRIPPAWTEVQVDPDPEAHLLVVAKDAAGRTQRLYSPEWIASAKAGKFERVRGLLAEWNDIGTQIERDLNDRRTSVGIREAALVAYLIRETGIRPGSTAEVALTTGIKAYGATTLQLRHVQPKLKCVVLAFEGVKQRVKVHNPFLVRELRRRKAEQGSKSWTASLFPLVSAGSLRAYFRGLGSGQYSPKDFRTACGTKLALELLGGRKRLPKAKAACKRLVNAALDKVAAKLVIARFIRS